MCSEIDERTRNDPQAAMLHQLEADAKPWPMSEEAKQIHGQIERKHESFDSDAHRRFMRSLG